MGEAGRGREAEVRGRKGQGQRTRGAGACGDVSRSYALRAQRHGRVLAVVVHHVLQLDRNIGAVDIQSVVLRRWFTALDACLLVTCYIAGLQVRSGLKPACFVHNPVKASPGMRLVSALTGLLHIGLR